MSVGKPLVQCIIMCIIIKCIIFPIVYLKLSRDYKKYKDHREQTTKTAHPLCIR